MLIAAAEPSTLGVIAAVIAGPCLLALISARTTRKAKEADWERADVLDARAAERDRVTNSKLDVIHTLVNSNMTAAMQGEHDSMVRELAMMRQVAALHEAAGSAPDEDALAAAEMTKTKIAELGATLKDRHAQAEVVADQEAVEAARDKPVA